MTRTAVLKDVLNARSDASMLDACSLSGVTECFVSSSSDADHDVVKVRGSLIFKEFNGVYVAVQGSDLEPIKSTPSSFATTSAGVYGQPPSAYTSNSPLWTYTALDLSDQFMIALSPLVCRVLFCDVHDVGKLIEMVGALMSCSSVQSVDSSVIVYQPVFLLVKDNLKLLSLLNVKDVV